MQPFIHIANQHARLAVSPSTGRIVEYALADGPNILWTNPRAPECAVPFEGWKNWGGDKVWLWPEGDWTKWLGKNVPPGDGLSYETSVSNNRITMTSALIPEYGVVIQRIIALENHTRVNIQNIVKKIQKSTLDLPVTPWTVTQLPAEGLIFAQLIPDAQSPGYSHFDSPWRDITIEGSRVTLRRASTPWAKVGLDANMLAKEIPGGRYFAIRQLGDSGNPGYQPLRRAQVFSDPDDSPFRLPGIPAYIELEFTGPLKNLAVGETAEMTLEWKILHTLGV